MQGGLLLVVLEHVSRISLKHVIQALETQVGQFWLMWWDWCSDASIMALDRKPMMLIHFVFEN